MKQRMVLALAAGAVVLAFVIGGAATAGREPLLAIRDAAQGKLRAPTIDVGGGITRTLPFFSGGTLAAAEEALKPQVNAAQQIAQADVGIAEGTLGCNSRNQSQGVRVNDDCSFRRQAEEDIASNPADPTNLLAGQNDSRMGFNQCWISYSTDNGEHWGGVAPPFRQHLNAPDQDGVHTVRGGPGTFHTYDADSDPTMAWDSAGRGYFSCVAFDIFSNASMVWVSNSPAGANGSFFFNMPVVGPLFLVAEDNSARAIHDKQFVIADAHPGSPNRDNVYLTWTVFNFSDQCGAPPAPPAELYCESPIYGSMSTDHARTWSAPERISGRSQKQCFFGNFFHARRSFHACNFDQGSDPAVLPNGDLVVVFNNSNTRASNPNRQQLAVVCHPSGDSAAGTAHLNCGSPSLVGENIVQNEPQCDFGRGPEECVPGPWIRTNDFPRVVTRVNDDSLYAVWQDYRNGEYDIRLTRSTDGGHTWAPSKTLNPDTGLDHYFPAVDLAADGSVAASYFRSERVPDENVTPPGGFTPGAQPGVGEKPSDYVVAGGTDLATPYDFTVVSPVFPPPDGIQAGFNGDYSGLVINRGSECHPIWSDTRNQDPFAPANNVNNDEDVFTSNLTCPNGVGTPGEGHIGGR